MGRKKRSIEKFEIIERIEEYVRLISEKMGSKKREGGGRGKEEGGRGREGGGGEEERRRKSVSEKNREQ